MHWKIRPVTQVPAAAHHRQVDAGASALHAHRQNVHILVGRGFNGLLVQHARQRRDLVAQLGRLLEFQLFGVRHHALLQVLQHFMRFAAQHGFGMRHIAGIGVARDQICTRAGAALDLVQQTGPGAVGKHRVFASAQAKHLLQQQDGFLHRPGAGVRAEIAVFLVGAAAVVGQARKSLGRRAAGAVLVCHASELQVRVAFVVAKQNVVARLQRFDEVAFQQQRLGFRAHHGGFQPGNLAHHVAGARAAMGLLEIAGHAPLEVERLAHIQQRALGVEIAVHAGQRRQRSHLPQQFFGMHIGHGMYCGRAGSGPGAGRRLLQLWLCFCIAQPSRHLRTTIAPHALPEP